MDKRPSATSEERRSELELIPLGQEQTQSKLSSVYISFWTSREVDGRTCEAGPFNPSFCALWVSLGCSGSTFRCVGVDLDSFGWGPLCGGHVRRYSACAVSPRSHGFGPRPIAPNLTPVISLSGPATTILTQRASVNAFESRSIVEKASSIAKGQREPEVEPDSAPDHLRRKSVAGMGDELHSPNCSTYAGP